MSKWGDAVERGNIDKQINKCVSAANAGVVPTKTHEDLYKCYESVQVRGDLDIVELSSLITRYDDDIKNVTHKLASERTAAYQIFLYKAMSEKGAQVFHRILKKKVDTIARPVPKKKSTTTADQDHANDHIMRWAKI